MKPNTPLIKEKSNFPILKHRNFNLSHSSLSPFAKGGLRGISKRVSGGVPLTFLGIKSKPSNIEMSIRKKQGQKLIREWGEYRLLEHIRKIVGKSDALQGIGDDAAVIKYKGNKLLLASMDAMIEGVHFNLKNDKENSLMFSLGWKAMAINLSDIAAMGGIAKYAFVFLGLRQEEKIENIEAFYKGMKSLADKFKVKIIGGDTSRAKIFIINLFMLGEVEKDNLLLRAGAKKDDIILTTGTAGDAAAGLALIQSGKKIPSFASALIKRHCAPFPRVKEARLIAGNKLASSMIDNSDGLLASVGFIARGSHLGARIYAEKLPISLPLRKIAEHPLGKKLKIKPEDYALSGGEDYELVFTVSKRKLNKALTLISHFTKTPVTLIGEMSDKKEGIKVLDRWGHIKKLKKDGYEHFK